jgi:hypothetical protein
MFIIRITQIFKRLWNLHKTLILQITKFSIITVKGIFIDRDQQLFRFKKMWEISHIAQWLLDSQEGIHSMQWVVSGSACLHIRSLSITVSCEITQQVNWIQRCAFTWTILNVCLYREWIYNVSECRKTSLGFLGKLAQMVMLECELGSQSFLISHVVCVLNVFSWTKNVHLWHFCKVYMMGKNVTKSFVKIIQCEQCHLKE